MDQIESSKELIAYREIAILFQKLYDMRSFLFSSAEHLMRHTTVEAPLPDGPNEGLYTLIAHTVATFANAINQMIGTIEGPTQLLLNLMEINDEVQINHITGGRGFRGRGRGGIGGRGGRGGRGGGPPAPGPPGAGGFPGINPDD